MPIMSKRKPSAPANEQGSKKKPQHALRFDDPRLLEALDRYAERVRQSRTAAILTILEDVLTTKGYYPPPDTAQGKSDGGS